MKSGSFVEVDIGHTFTYRKTNDEWAIRNGLPYEVDVGYDTRFAKISKSRCYMALEEGSDGKPVIEVWKIRNRKEIV